MLAISIHQRNPRGCQSDDMGLKNILHLVFVFLHCIFIIIPTGSICHTCIEGARSSPHVLCALEKLTCSQGSIFTAELRFIQVLCKMLSLLPLIKKILSCTYTLIVKKITLVRILYTRMLTRRKGTVGRRYSQSISKGLLML